PGRRMKYFALILLVYALSAHAGNVLPPNWPWRGITIVSNDGDNDPIEIEKLSKLHVNAVALSLNIRNTAQFENMTPEEAWNTNILWADRMLDACRRYGITGIITLFQVPYDPSKVYTEISPAFWDNPSNRGEAVRIAGKLAQHFRSRGAELGAYEILSEPVVYRGKKVESPESWPGLRVEIIREIRKYDSGRYVIVTPGFGGEPSSYKDFEPLSFPRIIYGVHFYDPHAFSHQGLPGFRRGMAYPEDFNRQWLINVLRPVTDFRKKYHQLVYIGEFSAIRWAPGANQYISDLIDLFDENGFSWMYFCYNSFQGWNPFYDETYTPLDEKPPAKSRVGFGSKRWSVLKKAYGKNRD
ncbi:MAG TPA: cellulase family glycosylhydrolase, partial [Burkholderiales bacterium]|nr:cellulase family glycosylhydrolase [Burkholderiales bacterium]